MSPTILAAADRTATVRRAAGLAGSPQLPGGRPLGARAPPRAGPAFSRPFMCAVRAEAWWFAIAWAAYRRDSCQLEERTRGVRGGCWRISGNSDSTGRYGGRLH